MFACALIILTQTMRVLLKVLAPSEKSFAITLHNVEVKVICHDALFMAQLQGDIARKYGDDARVININAYSSYFLSEVTRVININGHVMCCADLVFWDMPYGLGVAPWDVLLSDVEMETFFNQMACINRLVSFCLVLSIIYWDAGRVRNFMMRFGFVDIHPVYVYKPQQNTTGLEWIFAVEMMLVGYKGGIRDCALTFQDMNPVNRHNLLFAHQVGTRIKYAGEDEEVNTTQKNPNIASALGRIMCKPGSSALVLGAGSGSEVVGLARVGVHVVALERDHKQFKALTERLTSEAADAEQVLNQTAEEHASVQLLSRLASRFTKLKPDTAAHFADEDEEDVKEEGVSRTQEDAAEGGDGKHHCAGCGKPVVGRDGADCAKTGCVSGKMHLGCCERCCKCGKLFCSSDHAHDHGCPP